MCGLAGLLRVGSLHEGDIKTVEALGARLAHRGPDAAGLWHDKEAGIALCHQRLSIVDLSKAGAQPMVSASGRYVIAYNGEIYNHRKLRAGLEQAASAPAWNGTSDTEVLLGAIEAWGTTRALQRCRGMFAFALWDRKERTLSFARDVIGEKPLYLGQLHGGDIVFASELKALACHPEFERNIDADAIAQCLRHGFIPAPQTVFRQAIKLMPGEIVTIRPGVFGPAEWPRETFFGLMEEAETARQKRFTGSAAEAIDELDSLLRNSVAQQMVADVPTGVFLSGGIDSSIIAAMMQSLNSVPVETFSLGFEDREKDESRYARAIATHLGVRHNEVVLSGVEACDLVTKMPEVYDEPFCDESQLPTYALAQFTRQKVTVSLSGDGGDELFGGYRRYDSFLKRQGGGALNRSLRQGYAQAMLKGVVRPLTAMGLNRVGKAELGLQRLRLEEKTARFASRPTTAGYEADFTFIDRAHLLVPGSVPADDPLVSRIDSQESWTSLEKISTLDLLRYLPDNILVKLDRAAMAHSLETRVPMLDPCILRFALSLPDEIKRSGGEAKGILKAVLGRYVPRALWDRPKRGFGVPAAAWLDGPLRPLAAEMLDPATVTRIGILDPAMTTAVWNEFLDGRTQRAGTVWLLFMIQLYLNHLDSFEPLV